ncbi:MAG: hypothetical protein K2W92_07425 [Alphaproteobacteria bacterium]|nr:hypothetical protein [Alphaproteobacteria bacterium]
MNINFQIKKMFIAFIFTSFFITSVVNAMADDEQENINNIIKRTAIETYSKINENWEYPSLNNNYVIKTESSMWTLEIDKEGIEVPCLNTDIKDIIPALDELINRPATLECSVALKVVQINSIRNILGDINFIYYATDIFNRMKKMKEKDKDFNYTFFMELPSMFYDRCGSLGIGSFCYIKNMKEYPHFKPKGTARGYNMICVGQDQFISFSEMCKTGPKNKGEFITELHNSFLEETDVLENRLDQFREFCLNKKELEANLYSINEKLSFVNFSYERIRAYVKKITWEGN